MRTLFITKDFPPVVCGVGDYTYQLAKEFLRDNHAVSVLTAETAKAVKEDMHVHAVIPSWSIACIPVILNVCKKEKPDLILLQYVPYSFNKRGIPFWIIVLYLALKIKGYKIVTTFHEVGIRYTKNNIKRTITSLCQFFIAKCIAKMSYKNITSIDLYSGYLQKYSNEVYQIPIGANILPVPIMEDVLNGLKNRIAPNNEFIISTFGTRISDTILHTLAALKKDQIPIKLVLLGNLPSKTKEHFHKLAQNLGIDKDIYVTGYLSENELFSWLKASSLFVLIEYVSEKGEGGICTKSGSLAAAFAAGLPILGTKGDTTDAVFKNNENIFLINDDTSLSIKKRIIEIIDDPEKLAHVSANAEITFADFFSWDIIYKQYSDAIKK